jgi:hypothetical protein
MRQFNKSSIRQFGAVKVHAFIILLLLLIASGCKEKGGSHLPRKVMKEVLLDISLAEGYSIMVKDSLHPAGSKNYDSLAVFYKDIFAHHNITQQQFEESLDWYKENTSELDSVYAIMQTVISAWQSQSQTKSLTPAPVPLPGNPTGR